MMHKFLTTLLFSCLLTDFVTGQETVKIAIAEQISRTEAITLKLYKYNPQNQCDQSKAVSIIYGGKISSCFDYVKTISITHSREIINLIRKPSTYGNEDVACFDTEYALLIFSKSNVVIGYINISLSCNKLIANPIIPERERYAQNGLRNVGLSKKGRATLLSLLGINSHLK